MRDLRGRKDSLQARLLRILDGAPEKPAIAFLDSHGAFRWQTTQRLFDDALAFARGLALRGVSPGDTCLVVSANDETSTKLALGALLSGAVPLLLALPLFLDAPQRLAFAKRLAALSRKVRSRLTVVPGELVPEILGEGIAFAEAAGIP